MGSPFVGVRRENGSLLLHFYLLTNIMGYYINNEKTAIIDKIEDNLNKIDTLNKAMRNIKTLYAEKEVITDKITAKKIFNLLKKCNWEVVESGCGLVRVKRGNTVIEMLDNFDEVVFEII